ncbi:helix-turn-helix domain-containing protein [Heyndrickxia acidicola]|uniref:Helix-turn-helix transcriptional regulator n=1 Tax=Heyndrickxia acidicola TaxID=209389 RepID=A0ABU6MD22_9BACI|nr:helix-turn-helix transcriptional regulator [Heyndrickxia acidicola]MED1202568.1 helix-turn-helix transcriptional regulator [Heyndrickxia acidicola]
MKITADVLYKIRKVYRLTQVAMGNLINLSGAQVNRIEKKKSNLTDAVVERLISTFKLTPQRLSELLADFDKYGKGF